MDLSLLRQTLLNDCKLDRGQKIVVGVSGGADSLCLLGIMNELNYPLIVAHLDHQIRSESSAESQQVAAHAQKLGLDCWVKSVDVPELAVQKKISLEEAARIARYQFLFETARKQQAQAVAVAHTADDQVETILMHLIRGTGLSGLRGMLPYTLNAEWDSQIPLVRPMLGIWRGEVESYCEQYGLKPIHDLSNQDTTYFRNRLRHELIPGLMSYNPKIKQVLWRMGKTLSADFSTLDRVVEDNWKRCVVSCGTKYVALNRQALLELDEGLLNHIVRRAIIRLCPFMRDIDYLMITTAAAFINKPSNTRVLNINDRLWIHYTDGDIYITDGCQMPDDDRYPRLPAQCQNQEWSLPGDFPLENGWRLEGRFDDIQGHANLSDSMKDEFSAWIDAEKITGAITLRTWQPGDRFAPLGMHGRTVKLSDFWINHRVPRRSREKFPLICVQEDIIWIPGLRLSHLYRVTDQTRKALHLRLLC